MFNYYCKLALLNLRKKITLSILMVMLISVGVSVLISMSTLMHNMGTDPFPEKSHQLYFVQIDNQSKERRPTTDLSDLPRSLTYTDASYLYGTDTPALKQLMVIGSNMFVEVEQEGFHPISVRDASATTHLFFDMFDVPFLYGGGWDHNADEAGEAVIVITKELNEKLFGGINSVGKQIKINSNYVTVVGVIGNWYPSLRFYDTSLNPSIRNQAFIPIQLSLNWDISRLGSWLYCPDPSLSRRDFIHGTNTQQLISSECNWIILWAELDSEQAVNEYKTLLDNYVTEQKNMGRLPRPMNNHLTSLSEWVDIRSDSEGEIKVLFVISLLFLIVCLCNTNGIILSKLVARYKEVSLRRALGAKKISIFLQQILEITMIGVIGGILSIALAKIELIGMNALFRSVDNIPESIDTSRMFEMNMEMMIMSVVIAVVSAIVVSLIPLWRICNLPPSIYLKSQ